MAIYYRMLLPVLCLLSTVSAVLLESLRYPTTHQHLQQELQRANQEAHQHETNPQHSTYPQQRRNNLQSKQYDETRRRNQDGQDLQSGNPRNIFVARNIEIEDGQQMMDSGLNQQVDYLRSVQLMNDVRENYYRQMQEEELIRRRNPPVGRIEEAFSPQMYQEHRRDEVASNQNHEKESEFLEKLLFPLQPDDRETKRRFVRSLGTPRQTADVIGEFVGQSLVGLLVPLVGAIGPILRAILSPLWGIIGTSLLQVMTVTEISNASRLVPEAKIEDNKVKQLKFSAYLVDFPQYGRHIVLGQVNSKKKSAKPVSVEYENDSIINENDKTMGIVDDEVNEEALGDDSKLTDYFSPNLGFSSDLDAIDGYTD